MGPVNVLSAEGSKEMFNTETEIIPQTLVRTTPLSLLPVLTPCYIFTFGVSLTTDVYGSLT